MQYIEQSHTALRLFLSKGRDDVAQFNILKKEVLNMPTYSVTFGILGESHFIHISYDTFTFSEIFACTDMPQITAEEILLHDIIDNPVVRTPNAALSYEFNASIEEQHGYLFSTWLEHAQKTHSHTVSHTFPAEAKGSAPVTEVAITPHESKVVADTIHTYPNESLSAVSHSEFTIHSLK